MAVKILIKRSVPANKVGELKPLFQRLRTLAMSQPGYVSGETLQGIDNPEEYLIVSTWESADSWRQWVVSQARQEIQAEIDMLLNEKTEYEMYQYG